MNPKILIVLLLAIDSVSRAGVVYPSPPHGGDKVSRDSIDTNFPASFLGLSNLNSLAIAKPFRDYYSGPTDWAAGHGLTDAKPTTWRYFLLHGTNAVGSFALISEDGAGGGLKFNSLEKSNFPNETLEAVRGAASLPQLKNQDYELRRLECSPLLFIAVWLHGKSDDLFIPLPPTFGRWKEYQPYSATDMLTLLKAEAAKQASIPRTAHSKPISD